MKNNTQETKAALQKALAVTAQDNALTDIRYHIRAALDKLEHVEKKRVRREENSEKRELAKGQGAVHGYDPFRAIQAINEEIALTKAEIKEIQRRRKQPDDEKDDDDELQTVFG